MHDSIYEPGEDSFLIKKHVKQLAKGRVLEIGIGSGILAKTALENKIDLFTGVDINPEAIKHCQKTIDDKRAYFVKSNLFENIPHKQKYDTIIMNPPYLPESKTDDKETARNIAGGKKGYELIKNFLTEASTYLKPDGIILLLFSGFSSKNKIDSFIKNNLFSYEELDKKSIFFEELFVYKLKKSSLLRELEAINIKRINEFTKGKRGAIYTGFYKGKKVAIKKQLEGIEAKNTVKNEYQKLSLLNKYHIGPELILTGKDYFVYNFIEGIFITNFFKQSEKEQILTALNQIFRQLRKLDQLQLNKEEMTHPHKHIIITPDSKPVLIDFERCKYTTKPHNVTQFAQFLTSKKVSIQLETKNIILNKKHITKLCKEYSKDSCKFEKLLNAIMNQ